MEVKSGNSTVCPQYSVYVLSMLTLSCILISDLNVTNLFMHSLFTLFGSTIFYIKGVFASR